MTSLISATYSLANNQDVVIFLPKRNFDKRYRIFTRDFFSLLYKRQNNPSSSFYFYKDILWCQSQLNENIELTDLEIETRPFHGDPDFRKKYRLMIIDNFNKARINTSKEIVFIPIDRWTPFQIIGQKEIRYEGYRSILHFQPRFFILESVNELFLNSSFDRIASLIKNFDLIEANYVLHFSWPYLRGLKRFLSIIENQETPKKPRVIHLRKRYCFEIGKNFNRPEEYAARLSIEGDLWDRQYYPLNSSSSTKVLLPIIRSSTIKTIHDLEEIDLSSIHSDLTDISKLLVDF